MPNLLLTNYHCQTCIYVREAIHTLQLGEINLTKKKKKTIIHSKIKFLSLFANLHVVPHPYVIIVSVECTLKKAIATGGGKLCFHPHFISLTFANITLFLEDEG